MNLFRCQNWFALFLTSLYILIIDAEKNVFPNIMLSTTSSSTTSKRSFPFYDKNLFSPSTEPKAAQSSRNKRRNVLFSPNITTSHSYTIISVKFSSSSIEGFINNASKTIKSFTHERLDNLSKKLKSEKVIKINSTDNYSAENIDISSTLKDKNATLDNVPKSANSTKFERNRQGPYNTTTTTNKIHLYFERKMNNEKKMEENHHHLVMRDRITTPKVSLKPLSNKLNVITKKPLIAQHLNTALNHTILDSHFSVSVNPMLKQKITPNIVYSTTPNQAQSSTSLVYSSMNITEVNQKPPKSEIHVVTPTNKSFIDIIEYSYVKKSEDLKDSLKIEEVTDNLSNTLSENKSMNLNNKTLEVHKSAFQADTNSSKQLFLLDNTSVAIGLTVGTTICLVMVIGGSIFVTFRGKSIISFSCLKTQKHERCYTISETDSGTYMDEDTMTTRSVVVEGHDGMENTSFERLNSEVSTRGFYTEDMYSLDNDSFLNSLEVMNHPLQTCVSGQLNNHTSFNPNTTMDCAV